MDGWKPEALEKPLPLHRARLPWMVWVLSALFHCAVLFGLAHWYVPFGTGRQGDGGTGNSILQAAFLPGEAGSLPQFPEVASSTAIEVELPRRNDNPPPQTEPAIPEDITQVEPRIESTNSRSDSIFRKPVELAHVLNTPTSPPTPEPKSQLSEHPLREPPLKTNRADWALERNTIYQPVPGRRRGTGIGDSDRESTRFFGVPTSATKLAFVIDCSTSMARHQLFRRACIELKASLQSLTTAAQIQVICFNTEAQLAPTIDRKQLLGKNTSSQQQLVSSFLAGITPDGGTDRLRALQTALRLKPDAIYFLSDADEPILDGADLYLIDRENRHRTQIHVIEFGYGPLLSSENFLIRLARENDGAYRYCDVEPR